MFGLAASHHSIKQCKIAELQNGTDEAGSSSGFYRDTHVGSLGTRSCAFRCLQPLQAGQLSLYPTLWYTTNNIKLVRLYTLFRLYPSVSVFAVLE